MKPAGDHVISGNLPSPPMRGRGLKLCLSCRPLKQLYVAPHAGAWIETILNEVNNYRNIVVAPHAGAWIETLHIRKALQPMHLSPPMRGRGLKLIV